MSQEGQDLLGSVQAYSASEPEPGLCTHRDLSDAIRRPLGPNRIPDTQRSCQAVTYLGMPFGLGAALL